MHYRFIADQLVSEQDRAPLLLVRYGRESRSQAKYSFFVADLKLVDLLGSPEPVIVMMRVLHDGDAAELLGVHIELSESVTGLQSQRDAKRRHYIDDEVKESLHEALLVPDFTLVLHTYAIANRTRDAEQDENCL